MSDKALSIIIPLYNEEESLPHLIEWISQSVEPMGVSYEIIMVDDGSSDGSWEVIRGLQKDHQHLKALRFKKNFGKSAALNSGFKAASGEVVVTMDADLQDSPEEIPALYRMILEEDYDLVSGWKKKRKDPISKTIPSRFFNFVSRKISGIPLHDFNCGLKAYKLDLVKDIQVYGEMHRFIPMLAKWSGYSKIGEKPVTHYPRKFGKTKYGLERFINGFLDLLSVTFVSKFRRNPMHFFGTLGTISFLVGFFIAAGIIFNKLWSLHHHLPARDVTDQPLFFLALVALIVGMQLFLAGFLAEMITRDGQAKAEYPIRERLGD